MHIWRRRSIVLETNRAKTLIGLARRAGYAAAGEFSATKALEAGKAHLVLLAEDASENTKKKFRDKAAYRRVAVCIWLSKAELGRILGLGERSVAVITDKAMAASVRELIEDQIL